MAAPRLPSNDIGGGKLTDKRSTPFEYSRSARIRASEMLRSYAWVGTILMLNRSLTSIVVGVWTRCCFVRWLKQHRVQTPTTIDVSERFSIRIVPTHAYERNISLARIRAEREYSNGVLRLSVSLP